jgi:hypothetical protein
MPHLVDRHTFTEIAEEKVLFFIVDFKYLLHVWLL